MRCIAKKRCNAIFCYDGKTTPSLRRKLVRVFSPRKPRFRRRCAPLKVSLWRRMSAGATGIFILTGTTTPSLRKKLVRVFSPPLAPTFVAAFAALKVSFPGACPGKDDFYFDEETTGNRFA